jgi:hypothetical protein
MYPLQLAGGGGSSSSSSNALSQSPQPIRPSSLASKTRLTQFKYLKNYIKIKLLQEEVS